MRLLIGPANYAGQAAALASAFAASPGNGGSSAALVTPRRPFDFNAQFVLPSSRWAFDPVWRARWRRQVVHGYDAVLIDGGLPVTRGGLSVWPRPHPARRGLRRDVKDLKAKGLAVGLLFHGTEIRDPMRHMDREPHSPFHQMDPALVRRLRASAERLRSFVEDFDGPMLVTTPDLLLDCPRARWIPVSCDGATWGGDSEPRFERPRVLNAPSSQAFAGTALIDDTLQRLHEAEVIEYLRVSNVPHAQMPELITSADVVIDKTGMGIYGVLGVEGMMAGRLVLGHVSDQVRDHVRSEVGRDVPVVEFDPARLEDVIRKLCREPAWAHDVAARGREYALAVHDGRASAAVLSASFQGLP